MSDQDPTPTGGQDEEKPTTANETRLSVEEQIAAKVDAAQAPDFQPFNEETGEVTPRDEQGRFAPKAEADKEPESPQSDTPVPEPEPEPPKTHKVKVLGQEEEVPIEELIRNYQKGRAADMKLQEASRIKREADEYAARIRQGQPSQDAGQTQQQPPQGAAQPLTADDIRTILFNEKATSAGEQFREEFPDIAADPYLMDMAARLEQQRLQTASDLGEPIGDPIKAYRAHGEAVRTWLAKFKPADTASQDKLEKKRTVQAIPAAGARAPSAPAAEKPLTTSQVIELERQSRGGRPLPKR